MIASYRPILPAQAGSLWWGCWRAFLWAAVVAGIGYQMACRAARATLLNPKPSAALQPVIVFFGILWIIIFIALAGDILERKRAPAVSHS